MGEKVDWGEHRLKPDGSVVLAGFDMIPEPDPADLYTQEIVHRHYENFLVLHRLTPAAIHVDVARIYAFARYADDLGDEAPFPPEQRRQLLDAWEADLRASHADGWSGAARHPITRSLARTGAAHDLPVEPFVRLIDAFRMDQDMTRYDDWDHLMAYCIDSANPVGELYLRLLGVSDAESIRLSDATCSALQVANHLQDLSRDRQQDRCYLPLDIMAEHGMTIEDWQAARASDASRAVIAELIERTQAMFDEGKALWSRVPVEARTALRLFTYGGEAILRRIRRMRHDTLERRPRVSKLTQFRLLLRARKETRREVRNSPPTTPGTPS